MADSSDTPNTSKPEARALALRGLSMTDLSVLYDFEERLAQLRREFINQPRCSQVVVDLLDGEEWRTRGLIDPLVEEVRSRRPAGKNDYAIRSEILLRYSMFTGDFDAAVHMCAAAVERLYSSDADTAAQ